MNGGGLAAQPRISLATLPTPLQEAPRLRAALGGPGRCPKILIKRDDLTGLAFGGNKVRKLEFLVADALAQGATRLITAGAAQSNHARMTAAAARVAGLEATLVLTAPHAAPPVQGNLLLDRLLGADVQLIPTGSDELAAMEALAATLRERGERPYVIPVGGSNAIGVFGYVAATLELVGQLVAQGEAPRWLYYANGSRGTQAGLALGAKIYGASYGVRGIAVSGGDLEKRQRALAIATPACLEAIALLARHEAIFLDPVYSAKALAGLIADIRAGALDPNEPVVFLHTGGTPALFAHAETLVAATGTNGM
jgi:L-cysteate sulfo-lyase